eukprot:1158718-Pelagomonas_calceolata.AAC.2
MEMGWVAARHKAWQQQITVSAWWRRTCQAQVTVFLAAFIMPEPQLNVTAAATASHQYSSSIQSSTQNT